MQTDPFLLLARQRFPELDPQHAFVAPRWYLSQEAWIQGLDEASAAAYNYPLGLRIHGPLDVATVEKSVNELVERHAVLRSAFRIHQGTTLQIICAARQAPISLKDLTGLEHSRREDEARRAASYYAKEAFDFSRGPLLRAALMRLAPDDHVVVFTTHHLVCDDWSAGILIHDFLALYQNFCERPGLNAGDQLPKLNFQYGDFVRWRQTEAKQRDLSRSRNFWKQELAGTPRKPPIDPDRLFLKQKTFQGAHETVRLSPELLRGLTELSQRERASLFMTLLAGFQLVLKHHSGTPRATVGCCVANRERSDSERVVGPFANVVVLQTSIEDHLPLCEVLSRVRDGALEAYSHQDVPFGEFVHEMGYREDAAGNPYFQVLFVLQNAPKRRRTVPGLSVEDFAVDMGTTRYDLNLWVKTGEELTLDLQYNTNLFQSKTIKKVLREYEGALEWMVGTPNGQIDNLFGSGGQTAGIEETALKPLHVQRQKEKADESEATLLALWRAAFRNHELKADQDFFESGGDSLLAARLFGEIQKEFGIRLPLSVLCKAPTVKELAHRVRAAKKDDFGNSLVEIRPRGSRPPLLIIHEHGGEVLYARELACHLHPEQPVYAFQAPYVNGRPSFSTVEQMADAYVRELLAHKIPGPYFILGYCFGGLIGLEMAARLDAAGKQLTLAMLDTPAPGSLRYWPFPGIRHMPARARFLLQDFFALEPQRMPDFVFRKFRGVSRALLANGKSDGRLGNRATRKTESAAVDDRTTHIWQVHLNAARSYCPQVFADEITLFVTPEAPSSYDFDLREGWKSFADCLRVLEVPGNVTTVMRDPQVQVLAAKLTRWMAQPPPASSQAKLAPETAPQQSSLAAHG